MEKKQRAKDLLEKAKEIGRQPTKEGNWIVFRPPLPVTLTLEAADLGDELADLLEPKECHDRS